MKKLQQVISELHNNDMAPDTELFGNVEITDTEITRDEAEKLIEARYNFFSQFGEEIDIDSPKFDYKKKEEFERGIKKYPNAYMANGKYYSEK